jgi:hypothetical protein
MPRRKTVTVYVVQQVEWYDGGNGEFYELLGDDEATIFTEEGIDGVSPVKTFFWREKAKALCQELERKKRQEVNPFRYGSSGDFLGDFTSLTPARFLARLRALNIPPPEVNRHGMGALTRWWDEVAGGLDEQQRNGLWDALDLAFAFFTVVSAEIELQA